MAETGWIGSLDLLGGCRLARSDGTEITLGRKPRALLAALALAPHGEMSRVKLMELLWGDSAEDQARASLRQALAQIRRAVGPDLDRLLTATADRVTLHTGEIVIDALAFARLATAANAASLEQATALYRGDFLDGLHPEAPGFEEWAAIERQRLRLLAAGVLTRLLDQVMAAGDLGRATGLAMRLLTLEPLQESTHRALMRLFALQGQPARAVQQFRHCRDLLERELGVRPEPETEALYRAIREQRARPATGELQLLPRPDSTEAATGPERRPSVAVLPFLEPEAGPDTGYFGYGLAEDIIRLLARNRWLKVLSRHSTLAYQGRQIDPREINRDLGARYVVQGGVQRRGEQVRITTDLIDAESGDQLWSDRFDLDRCDIFEIQSAIAQQIAAMIEPELASIEREAAQRKPPGNLGAWDFYQRGLWHLWAFTTPALAEAEAMFRHSLALDPGFARAHAGLSYVQLQSAGLRGPEERPALLQAALEHARLAVALDERDCMCHCVLGRAHCMHRHYEDAIAALEHALELNPSFAQGYFALGHALAWSGREHEALGLLERAIELSPRDPHRAVFHELRATVHFLLGELEDAISFARAAVRLPNAGHRAYVTLLAALGWLDRREEARPFLDGLLQRKPNYSLGYARQDFFFCADPEVIERFVEGLRRAGVPA